MIFKGISMKQIRPFLLGESPTFTANYVKAGSQSYLAGLS